MSQEGRDEEIPKKELVTHVFFFYKVNNIAKIENSMIDKSDNPR